MDSDEAGELSAKNKGQLAIFVDVYGNNLKRDPAVLFIIQGILIVIYKRSKNLVIEQVFKFNNVTRLLMAENVPSAAALQFQDEMQETIHKSHLIIESSSMGLLLRYIHENDFSTLIDFCSEVRVTDNDQTQTFKFSDLDRMKTRELNRFSNGVLRSTCSLDALQLKVALFSSKWVPIKIVVSNIGIFFFDQDDLKERPGFLGWSKFNCVETKPQGEQRTAQYKKKNGETEPKTIKNLFVLRDNEDKEFTFGAVEREKENM